MGEVTAQTLDNAGRTVAEYAWYDIDGEYYGWYTEDEDLADVAFLPGEGLYLRAPSTDYSIKSAGEVPTVNIAVQLRYGAKHVINPTPVAVSINDEDNGVTISGYDSEEGCMGDVTAQTLDSAGRTVAEYAWYDIDGEYYGWYTEDEDLADITLQPGEGLYFRAPDDTYYVNFKGIEIK